MPNRRLSQAELDCLFAPFVTRVREQLQQLSSGDPELLWALRRKLAKELSYDERGKPMHRKLLKAQKRGQQKNQCAICASELPDKNAVLDRVEAMKGYTTENTRLLCPACDVAVQEQRGYT
jgi:hypothetical protein